MCYAKYQSGERGERLRGVGLMDDEMQNKDVKGGVVVIRRARITVRQNIKSHVEREWSQAKRKAPTSGKQKDRDKEEQREKWRMSERASVWHEGAICKQRKTGFDTGGRWLIFHGQENENG